MQKKIKFLLSYVLLASFVIPEYPLAKKLGEHKMDIAGASIEVVIYSTQDSCQKVMGYYKENLSRDFDLSSEKESYLLFTNNKENTQSRIKILCEREPKDQSATLTVSYATGLQDVPNPEDKIEAPGKDVFWLRRYPDSIRTSYMDTPDNGFVLEYQTQEQCLKCVIDYYRAELYSWGWMLDKETSMKPERNFARLLENIPSLKEDLGETAQQIIDEENKQTEISTLFFKKQKSRCILFINQQQGWVKTTAQYFP